MNPVESQAPLLTVYTTVYNSKGTIQKSLESIIRALEGFEWEAVVVDNFSTDGTYELLLEYSKKIPLRVYRYRCSRGLGRFIASKVSRGKYLIYADMDCLYDSHFLKQVILAYLRSRYRDIKCWWLHICPKQILEDYNFRDLNIHEDTDLATRLRKSNLMITLPPLKRPLKEEMRDVSDSNGLRWHLLRLFSKTRPSEKRYAKGFFNYVRREIRNQLDLITGNATTLSKFIREELYVYGGTRNPIRILWRTLPFLLPLMLSKLLRKPIFEADALLSNYYYLLYEAAKESVNPTEIGLLKKDISPPSLDDRRILYIARFYPDIVDAVKKRRRYISANCTD